MAEFTKTLRATASAQYAKESGPGGKFGPQISGKDAHIYLSSEANNGTSFAYSGAIRWTLDAAAYSGVINIKKAVIRFHNVARGGHLAARANSGYTLRFLTKPFEDNSQEEGEWEEPDKNAPTHLPTYDARLTKNGMIATTTVGGTESIDVTDWMRRWAPKRVKVKGQAGLGGTNGIHRGIWIVRKTNTKQGNPRIVWGSAEADESDRPELILTYEGGDPRGTVIITGSTNPLPSISDQFYEGSYIPGVEGARLARLHLRLFKRNAANTAWETTVRWQNSTNGEAVSASEAETGDWVYPVGGSTGYPLPSALLASGVRYAFQVRAQSSKGVWSDWTALQEIKVQADSPVFEDRDLLPNALGSGTAFAPPTSETLLNVFFGGNFRASGANLTHALLSYRVQVRDETDETDPAWDGAGMHWDSGMVPVAAGKSAAPTAFGSRYKGRTLEPGTYSFRVMVVNRAGEPSPWRYGTFDLTLGQDLDPADNDSPLTGYARRQPKVRIRIRSIEASPQKIITRATSGTFKVRYDGTTSAHVTGALAWNISAAALETALEALPGVGDVSVSLATDGTKRTYTITFNGGGLLEPERFAIHTNSLINSGSKGVARVELASTRKPGRTIALIDDASNIGASEYYNSPGEFYFTLPHTHPQISVIEPWQVHYSLELHRGNGWEEVTAGLIHDFDADDEQVVFYGVDYLGVLSMMIDERFNPEGSPKRPAQLYPPSDPPTDGSYYLNKTIKQIVTDQIDRAIHGPDSPLAFFSRGAIADMTETIIIYCTFKERLSFITGLLESWKGKGTASKRTRIRWRRTSGGGYEFRVDDNPGFSRDNLLFEYGGLVNGFRVIPYGDFGTRVNAMGREIGGSKLQYTIATTPVPSGEDADFNEKRYGRWPTVNLWQDITDKADLSRRARQFARSLGKVGKQVGLGIRVDAMALKDGWDITDSVPVSIRRGIVDTSLYQPDENGRSWWTIWGWVLKVSPDGHTNLTLSILPREDTLAASEDITPSAPILANLNEWAIHPADPTPDDADGSAKRWTNSVTGETFELDPETGLWVSITNTMTGQPALLAAGGVVSDYLADDAVIERTVATDAISTDAIQSVAITSAKIGPDAVTNTKIADNAVETAHIQTGAVTDTRIADNAVTRAKLDAELNPVLNVPDINLITLPDPDYPAGTLVWDEATQSIWKVESQAGGGGGAVDVFVPTDGVPGPEGSFPSFPTPPDLPVVVAGLPVLPNGTYPIGTQVYDSTTGNNYVNVADVWQQFAYEAEAPVIFDESTRRLKKYENGAWVDVVRASNLTGQITASQIEANAITADHISAGAVGVSELAADLVLSSEVVSRIIRTATSGQRIEMDPSGFRAYDSGGDLVVNIPTAGDVVTINAEVWAQSLTVDPTGSGSSMGGVTVFPGSALAYLAAGIANPAVAPTVVDSLDFLTIASAPAGHGINYDASGFGGVATYLMGGDPSVAGGYVFKEYNASTGALIRTISPSNSSSVTTETVGATSHVSDTADALSGSSDTHISTPLTIPTRSGTIKVTAVSAYFAGYGGSASARTCLWNSANNLLGESATFTAVNETFNNGNSNHYNKSLSSPVTVSSGQSVRAGFRRTSTSDGFQYDKDDGSGKTTYSGDGTSGDGTGWGTRDTAGKPNVYLTIEVTQTVTVEGTMGKIIGIARAGSYIFVLDTNGKLFRYNQSDGSYSAQYNLAASILGVKANAGLLYDGTNLCLLTTDAASGASNLRFVFVNTSGALTGTAFSGAVIANAATVVLRGGYNDGTNFWLYNSERSGVDAYTKTGAGLVSNRTFSTNTESSSGVTFDGTVFRSWVTGTTKVYKYTTWDWSTATDPYWFAYSWVDVGTAETAVSPRTSITIGRRRRVLVTNPTPPGGVIDSVYVYALPNASSPAGTAMKRQATGLATSRFISSYNSGGTAGLSTTTFGAGTSAELKAEGGQWSLKGDGTVAFDTTVKPGGKPAVVNVYTSGTGTWTKPAGIAFIIVECQGGGGAGGGAAATATAESSSGGGGGGGGYARKKFTAADLAGASSFSYAVGAGGTGVSGGTGNTGGNSTFSGTGITTVQGSGGLGGSASANTTTNALTGSGSGGSASGGDINCLGQDGTGAGVFGGIRTTTGTGGSSVLGGGAKAGNLAIGAAGNAYGGGGGGSTNAASTAAKVGGAGAAGVVIVTEFYGS